MKKTEKNIKEDKAKESRSSLVRGAENESSKPFVGLNFIFMGISLVMIIVGFLLMTGSANTDPNVFNEDIFSTRRIVVGPAIAFLGFVAMAFAIVYSPSRRASRKTAGEVIKTEEK